MTIIGGKLLEKDPSGRLLSRIGTVFLRTPGLVTKQGVHALQRMLWIDSLNAERAAAGMEPLSREEEDAELAQSVDLVFTDDCILIRPDPARMDLAFQADEVLQTMVSKRLIRFLNTHSGKVRNALRARGENWRMAREPISQEDISRLVSDSRTNLAGGLAVYYSRVTGTRYMTVEGMKGIFGLPPAEMRRVFCEAQAMLSSRNRTGRPELDIFPVTTPVDIKAAFKAIEPRRLSDAELKRALVGIDARWRATIPAELREESIENFSWRNEMCATLTRGPNDSSVDEDELIQGISPEFFRQIEWLPGVRINGCETVFDPLWEECDRTRAPELQAICDPRARNILFNVSRFLGDVEYVNIGRLTRSLARSPIEGSRRGNVYIVQFKPSGDEPEKVRIVRFQKWGVAEHLDEGKDLLSSILESEEYTDYIVDRRLMCMQLGMNLPRHLVFGNINERYSGGNQQYKGVSVRACYFARSYIPGTASDKIPPAKFRNPAFALGFARLMGAAAATDLVVGRRSTETKENLFDKNCEVLQFGADGLPARVVVTDHGGSCVNYIHSLEESVPPYANVVRRRKAFVADYKAFADEFVASFRRGIEGVQAKYRANRRAFDCLFSNRPYDMAGSGAYRWAKILERLDNADPARVAEALSRAISSEE